MTRHVFLTGDIQVGKSTIINRVLEDTELILAGFKTLGANYLPDGSSDIVIFPCEKSVEEGFVVANRSSLGKTVYPEVFDEKGVEFLLRQGELVIMDELGYMESDAKLFQRTVLELLDKDTPVLGVLRNMHTPFLDAVRNNKNVEVIFVTKDNREEIFLEIQRRVEALK